MEKPELTSQFSWVHSARQPNNNVMWGSDFPHPDGIWPDSQEFLNRELTEVSPEARRKIVRDNAMKLYRLGN